MRRDFSLVKCVRQNGATSWGTILSAKLLERNPNAVDGVVAAGQIIKNVFFADEVMESLERTNVPKKKLDRLKSVTIDNYSGKDLRFWMSEGYIRQSSVV